MSVENHQRAPIARQGHEPRIGLYEADAAPFELHVGDDRRPERSDRVRQRRRLVAGREFFAGRAAADHVAPLEDERLPASLREIERRGQRVVAAADDDDVVRHHFFPVSFRMRIAALRPGAPMMPPPGCVADPHM